MNYEKMWEELKKTVELIKTPKMKGIMVDIITGVMLYIEDKIQELEEKYNKGASND